MAVAKKKKMALEAMVRQNIEVMNALEGFNVVVVCCSSQLQADYWQKRLEEGRGSVLPPSSIVLAVEEDWPGGAGNGECSIASPLFSLEFLLNLCL